MKGNQRKKEGEKRTPDKAPRPSLFSIPVVVLVIIVACLAAFLGNFLYTNKSTELQQEFKIPNKHEYGTEKLDQRERVNPTTHQTTSPGGNSFNQDREASKPLTDKETSASPERKIHQKNGKQEADDDDKEEFKILPRREGVKVGHVQNLELEPGKFYDVITRSLQPPIFEIPDFLAKHECEKIMDKATKLGLRTSQYVMHEVSDEPTNQDTFKKWDHDHDDVITPQEVAYVLQDSHLLYFKTADIEKMFVDLDIDHNGNGVMDLDEFLRVTNTRIVRYLVDLSKTIPRTLLRNSKHSWLEYDDVKGLNQRVVLKKSANFFDMKTWNCLAPRTKFDPSGRVSKLTNFPLELVERSERLQVVNYGPEGHYYCHVDSQNIEQGVPCCLATNRQNCRYCRYITVLYFLNDVEEGGETAFPLADNETLSYKEWMINKRQKCDLGNYCHNANVYVKPRQGTAIMWYNHFRDEQTGWLGEVDPRSYHGGCDVIKGHKWIANSWLHVVGDPSNTLATYTPLEDPIP